MMFCCLIIHDDNIGIASSLKVNQHISNVIFWPWELCDVSVSSSVWLLT